MKKLLLIVLMCWCSIALLAQTNISGVINSYAPVTDISFNTGDNITNCNTARLTVGTRYGEGSDFAVGDKVLIIQMKGAFPFTGDNGSFGYVDGAGNSGMASAGNFEFSTVDSIETSGGNQIVTLGTALDYSYDENGFVQLVKVPEYATGATVTSSGVQALEWTESNGAGGVVCFLVTGTLTLNGDIDVSGTGFEGGASVNSGSSCNYTYYYANSSSSAGGKGEGIVVNNTNFGWGRGVWSNGGGGGHGDAGGGGGAGAGTGGRGAMGIPSGAACSYVGEGGRNFTYSSSQVFLGGGGGGGHSNGGSPSNGGDGGGIVIIEADNIVADGGARNINANGNDATDTNTTDGAGGGGGGGAIYIQNNGAYSTTGGGSLSLTANGGDGGTAGGSSNNCSGSGGGGGGGAIHTNSGSGLPSITVNGGTTTTVANCTSSGNGNGGATSTALSLNTSPTCTEDVLEVATLCAGSLGDNVYTDGDFGVITGVNEVAATASDWIGETFKNNVAPWNTLAPGYTYNLNTNDGPVDGAYTIVTGVQDIYGGVWEITDDNSGSSDGFLMLVNCSWEPSVVYEQTITGLCEESRYEFSVDLINVDVTNYRTVTNPTGDDGWGPNCDTSTDADCPQKVFSAAHTAGGSSSGGARVCPDIEFLINDAVVGTTGAIPNDSTWTKYGVSFLTNTGVTSVKLTMRNKAPGGGGNDLGIDNIEFRPCGPTAAIIQSSSACGSTTYSAVLGSGYSSPEYQWQYSTDNGATWLDISGETSSTYTIASPVSVGHDIRYLVAESSSNLASSSCRVISDTETIDCVLPISLISFYATKKDDFSVALDWASVSETNSKHYEIERSTDGKNFSQVGVVDAAGESHEVLNYSFIDRSTESLGIYYYRLKMVDRDETFEYSAVREIIFMDEQDCKPSIAIKGVEQIDVRIPNGLIGQEYVIVNALGQTVVNGVFQKQSNTYNTANWASGVYLLKYFCQGAVRVEKFWIE